MVLPEVSITLAEHVHWQRGQRQCHREACHDSEHINHALVHVPVDDVVDETVHNTSAYDGQMSLLVCSVGLPVEEQVLESHIHDEDLNAMSTECVQCVGRGDGHEDGQPEQCQGPGE